jgi:hypothetical protein
LFLLLLLLCLSSSCVLCTHYCQCLWVVHAWFAYRFSLTFIQHVDDYVRDCIWQLKKNKIITRFLN